MNQEDLERLGSMDVRLGNLEEAVEESREVLGRIECSICGAVEAEAAEATGGFAWIRSMLSI